MTATYIRAVRQHSAPFDGCRRLAGNIVNYATRALYLIADTSGNGSEYLMRDRRILAGHKVGGTHRAKCNGVVVGTEIAYNADRARIGR